MFPGVTPSDLRARQADLLREESRGRPSRRPATSPRLESWFKDHLRSSDGLAHFWLRPGMA